MKILTIVIPTYNVEKYLQRCLDSILYDESVLQELEIIIVNDGSKDNSLFIAKEYEKKYPNTIIVIDKENGGHGSTINAGLKIATGKYFKVIDSDDWVNIDDFPLFVKALKKTNADIVLTNYSKECVYLSKSEKFRYNEKLEYNKLYSFEKNDLSILNDDYFFMAVSTFKTDKLKKSKLYLDEKTFYVDMEFILLPIIEMDTFIYLDFDIYKYYIGRMDQSVNIKNCILHRDDHEKVLRRLVEFYNNSNLKGEKKDYVKRIITYMCNSHYVIYCKAKLAKKKYINELKKFDNYLFENALDIYNEIGLMFPYIKWNRKTNYVFAQSRKSWFSRVIDKLYCIRLGGKK